MAAPTWSELLDAFLAHLQLEGRAEFTRREVADWWVETGLVDGSDPAWVRQRASRALITRDRAQRDPRRASRLAYAIRSQGYGPVAVWRCLTPLEAVPSIKLDARDAAERLVRDLASHARRGAAPDPAMAGLVEVYVDVVTAQLLALQRSLDAMAAPAL